MATLNVKNVPDTLYQALKPRAESRHRSMAQEVVHILTEVLAPQGFSILDLDGLGKETWSEGDAGQPGERERAGWDGSRCGTRARTGTTHIVPDRRLPLGRRLLLIAIRWRLM
ncbi:FitA-like ribbon-helix-helix domain-containing protein [Longimicrobium sp.]|uniref:FitA-like ribbon-helix-helix domain-containing protein n=1 Tax=Longimicrobium sp. TaxID=2029185 RepID=UPI0039C99CCA